MKYILPVFLYFLIFVTTSSAQNLVPNYSFEQADSCPTGFNNRAYKYSLGCVGWGQATINTSDYYNACDTAAASIGKQYPIVGVPNNLWGHQAAYNGDSYTGIGIYVSTLSTYKEYLITTIPALQVDVVYKVTIYISLADSSRFATDGMGVLFTTYGSPDQYSGGTLLNTPQIDYQTYGIISDTIHWIKLSKTFIADSNYTNLIIGGFKDASKMKILDYNTNCKKTVNASYYYVDNIIVEKLSTTDSKSIDDPSVNQIYPNPVNDRLQLMYTITGKEGAVVQIEDISGRTMITQSLNSGVLNSVDVSNLVPGMYLYRITEGKKTMMTGKVAKY